MICFQKGQNICKTIKNSPLAEGFSNVFIPGEIECEKTKIRQEEGIPMSEEIYSELEKISKTYQEPLNI